MIFLQDTTLYHPVEGAKLFPQGEQHPGAAWFDNQACKPPETAKTAAGVVKAYEEAVVDLERRLGISTASLAEAAGRAEAAVAKADELGKHAAALERERDQYLAQVQDVTKERDHARAYCAELERKIAKFDGDGDGSPGGSVSSAEKDELIAQLESLGLKPDKRKSPATLRAELDAATAPAAA